MNTLAPYGKYRLDRAQPIEFVADRKTVLILERDIFLKVGGGQSAYRKLIELNPGNIYYYFSEHEGPEVSRPANAKVIPYKNLYYPNTGDIPSADLHMYWDYFQCWQMAVSTQEAFGRARFDVIDTPDYTTSGIFARRVFADYGIEVGTVALALHGTISSALRDLWPNNRENDRLLAELRVREHLQYRCVDVRYALSQTYAEHWRKLTSLEARPLDPTLMTGTPDPVEALGSEKPDILFIGRRERRKGPDIALDLAWAAGQENFGALRFIGGDSPGANGVGADQILQQMAQQRLMPISIVPPISRPELDALYRSRNVVLLPSRYDQFNLIALEAMQLGCPAIVSNETGVAAWIRENHPELSDLILDISCNREGADTLKKVLLNYDSYRQRVVESFSKPVHDDSMRQMSEIYDPLGPVDQKARDLAAQYHVRFESFSRPREMWELAAGKPVRHLVNRSFPRPFVRGLVNAREFYRKARNFRVDLRPLPRRWAAGATKRLVLGTSVIHPNAARQLASLERVEDVRRAFLQMPERTSREIRAKLAYATSIVGDVRIARIEVFREMARLERKRGGDLVAATYCLRIMRWHGSDLFGDLSFVIPTLRKHGFEYEARAADAMFGDPARSEEKCRAFLEERFEANLTKRSSKLEILDDRRGKAKPKVSVIVSLYNAATKLPTLLDNLYVQSLNEAGQLEVVLVDSGSPTDEYRVFKEYIERRPMPIVYARSKKRETIQSAWNRGIKLANAPYLSFLGADEGVHPDCLLELSRLLDEKPDVDWVMADSVVTNVDANGIFASDIMRYNRTGYTWQQVLLETCYLSWVGGLYRKSIHDRFGYYDETFGAAGDTEFKGRIISKIKTLHVPKVLGVFNNYPEERTTQSPRAEIEDLRAWYLHRSPAGVAYSFDAHPIEEAEEFFRESLSYRKSFCGHISSDADMAQSVASYLVSRGENPEFARKAKASADDLVTHMRAFDHLDFRTSVRRRQLSALGRVRDLGRQEAADQGAFALETRPQYNILNDNRHEQHWWSWSN